MTYRTGARGGFARLTPEQRRDALQALAQHVPASEIGGDDPASLARTATRAEMRQPGTLERSWGSGLGLGSWFMTTLAASFIGSAIAQSFFDTDSGGSDAHGESSDGGDTAAGGSDGGGDMGGGDFGDMGGGGGFGGF